LLVAIASAAFATSSPLARLARPAHPLLIACGRVALAAVVLGVLGRRGMLASVRALSGSQRVRLALAGVLLGAHFACYQWGLDLTSLPAAVSLVSLEPLAVVLSAWAIFGIRPQPLERAGVLLATAGAVIVARGAGHGEHRIAGDLLVLGAVGLFGFYVASARALSGALPAQHYAPLVYAIAALSLALVLPFVPTSETSTFRPPLASLGFIALLAAIPTGIGHTALQTAARTESPSLVALASPGETVGSIAIGAVMLGALPSFVEAVGSAVIIAGAVIAVVAQRPPAPGAPAAPDQAAAARTDQS
ncbi:MAG TPA: DMT family transporter, partial [Polyangiaceae bacterium]|nr:DMT family transporter [Polyangiaceae bacterium]